MRHWGIYVVSCAALMSTAALAADSDSLVVRVRDGAGKPVRDALVVAEALDAAGNPLAPGEASASVAVIDQIERKFTPHVSVIRRGTTVDFPNSDQIRHSIYSFSGGNAFEIKLYRGFDAPPIRFDEAGLVVMGCNIHDYMLGYLWVVETPHAAITDENGAAKIAGLAAGRHRVSVRHPRAFEAGELAKRVLAVPETREVELDLSVSPPDRPRLEPPPDALQDSLGGFGT